MLERLRRELDAAERRLASERRAEEQSAARLVETARDVERRRVERDDAKARRDEARGELAIVREELATLERARRAEDEAMARMMRAMDDARDAEDEARRRRLDETRAAIALESDMRETMVEVRTSLELSDEIYERSKGLEGVGPWRDFDLGDVPDDLVRACARVVEARRENDAIRDALLAKGADANDAARERRARARARERSSGRLTSETILCKLGAGARIGVALGALDRAIPSRAVSSRRSAARARADMDVHFVYVLECERGAYYVGVARSVPDRVAEHRRRPSARRGVAESIGRVASRARSRSRRARARWRARTSS